MTARFAWSVNWVSGLAFALGAVVVITSLSALAINVATVLLRL